MTIFSTNTAAGFSPLILTHIFTRLPVSSLASLARTNKHWRLCTQREEYYKFLIEKLQILPQPDEAPWQTFFHWKCSRNFIVLLDVSSSMAHLLNGRETFFHVGVTRQEVAIRRIKKLCRELLPKAHRGINLICFNAFFTKHQIRKIEDLDFLHNQIPTAGTDTALALAVALNMHKFQKKFPAATRTEIHMFSDMEYQFPKIRSAIQRYSHQSYPQVLLRCYTIGRTPQTKHTVKQLQTYNKKRSAKNRWHLSMTFPKKQCLHPNRNERGAAP